MPKVYANGIEISYDDLGNGEPALLFMPGWCANRTVFHDLAPRCAAHRRRLALDWRGHGESGAPLRDFNQEGLVEDALAVIESSQVRQVIPVALAHAGWVAIELRHRLRDRIPKLVLMEWLILEPPPPFLKALQGMQSPDRWRQTVDQTLALWMHGVDNPRLERFLRTEMGTFGFEMWARAARNISDAYYRETSPMQALSRIQPSVPVLHVYATPEAPEFLAAQQAFAAAHSWFQVEKLAAHSHFPMFEVPDAMASAIEQFVA